MASLIDALTDVMNKENEEYNRLLELAQKFNNMYRSSAQESPAKAERDAAARMRFLDK